MHADERDICLYLKSWPGQFVSGKEIARRAGGKSRFRKDPNWAVPLLLRMVETGVLESDASGHFRLRPRGKKNEKQQFISPEIQEILERSGKSFGGGQTFEIEHDGETASGEQPP